MNNLNNMFKRLINLGGEAQQNRMIKDKQQTLKRAVKYSYQGALIQLIGQDKSIAALMNPNKLLEDYDEKILSVDYGQGIAVGSVFKWLNPIINAEDTQCRETYWIVYLQDLTELAYFRANVRRCEYKINWLDENQQIISTYASIIGPKQENITSISRSQFNMDIPNYTISILVPMNSDTLAYFKRYAKFYLQDSNNVNHSSCWRVEAIDSLSLPGILQIHAREYYANKDEDDVENGIVAGKIKPILDVETINLEDERIVGDNFIKPKLEYEFEYIGDDIKQWSINNSQLPVTLKAEGKKVIITWNALYSGQFILSYGNYTKTIIVESMF